MARRMEVELTSRREDGTWTWRAAGARQPKGTLDGSLLHPGARVGDVLRVDAEIDLDGITVTAVLPPRATRAEPERLDLLGPPPDDEALVTTTLAPQGRSPRRDRRRESGPDREGRRERSRRDRSTAEGGERPHRERRERSGGSRERPDGERRPEGGKDRGARPARPKPEPRPRPPRLRPGRAHRNAVLAELPDERKPIAEQVLRGGIPAVRQAIDKQNEANRAAGVPEISAEPLVALAEELLPRLRVAEWRDRAEAALASVEVVDLRDLRSVVVAADAAARDDETRALAEQLREALARRVEAEHRAWLTEIAQTLREGRVVRALRLSSRPPKAGARFPAELAAALAEATAKGLTAGTAPDRYAMVLDALAYSPVRSTVIPEGVPAEPGPDLLGVVTKLAARIPQVAERFGVDTTAAAPGARRGGGSAPPPPAPSTGREAPTPTPPREAPPPVAGRELEAPPAPASAPLVTPEGVPAADEVSAGTDA